MKRAAAKTGYPSTERSSRAGPLKTSVPVKGAQEGAAERRFPIVGIGASAGGLEAFTTLLQHLSAATGMAFVLIQHLDPTHTSFLREALVKTTTMSVAQAVDGMRVEPNHVYVIPPNACLGIEGGRLTVAARPVDPRTQNLPIDFFFGALARERGSRAIGVVLSGTASDGTEGLKAIKEAGGITFAQDPTSAKFGGMPQSAIDRGAVDSALPLPELAAELARLSHHPYVVARETTAVGLDAALESVFALVEEATRIDFSEYKSPSFERRLVRRMALKRVETIAEYLQLLKADADEVVALAEDALIHVTSFFRDPEAFDSLTASVFPAIVKAKPERAAIRVWVAGCATGEEVYSLAISLVEFLGESTRPIQIFGSDLSAKAIDTARAGLYPDTALRDISEDRRRRHFTKTEQGYRIATHIRELCVFVQHDLARDPPFSKLDLVSCRNVLIYFDSALQKRVIPMFHYALTQPGFLALGRAESISGWKQLFDVVDKANKLFARTAVESTLHFSRRLEPPRRDPTGTPVARSPREDRVNVPTHAELSQRVDRLLSARYAPPGIVVNEKLEVLEYRGETGAYLRPAPGEPQNNAMQMARGGLAMSLRATVAAAKKGSVPVRTAGVDVDQDGVIRTCDLLVIPLVGPLSAREPLYLVLFEELPPARGGKRPKPPPERSHRRQPKLEQELTATKEYLQTIIREHGRTSEDLGSANEELVSGNEELQSMNEELETAKEELQSINEELSTVNDELSTRNQEVTQVNSDLVNVLTAVDIPILILDAERRIRRFTPKARRILNVVASDIGRPFGDIKPNIDALDLDVQIVDVIETMAVRESEVQDRGGRWYRLQIRPYKTTDNRIDGAILCLFDIDALKHHVKSAEVANAESGRANQTKDDFLATLSHELRTPLSSMLMRAQLLRGGGMDDEKVKRAGAAIEAGVKRQVQLINDLLDVSRIVTGKLNLELQPIDLARTVAVVLEGLGPAIERKSLSLEVLVPAEDSLGKVNGDDSRLQQVVTNLVGNAIKFTPERGRLTITLVAEGENAVLRVSDTGAGIDPAFLPVVFDRFAQDNSTSTRAYGGLGLGLAIVRHLVELHHGTVVAKSDGAGLGSTFTVAFPMMKDRRVPVSLASRPSPTAYDTAALSGLRVLVMDDDRATREAIADMLGTTGASVRLAESAAEGLKAVLEFRPEVMLCDIAMPGEDGYTFMRKLRALASGEKAAPALALTALAHDDDRDRALAAGYQMHMAKPVDIGRLTVAILELAASRGPRTPSAPN